MSVMSPFPMPNDELDGGIVVASAYLTDDTAVALLLWPREPFYRVIQVKLDEGPTYPTVYRNAYEDIVDALREYQEQRGDV